MPSLAPFTFSRRHFLGVAGDSPLTIGFDTLHLLAQEKQPAAALAALNRFPRTVQEWYVEQVRAAEKIGNAARAKLKTKADAEAYTVQYRCPR